MRAIVARGVSPGKPRLAAAAVLHCLFWRSEGSQSIDFQENAKLSRHLTASSLSTPANRKYPFALPLVPPNSIELSYRKLIHDEIHIVGEKTTKQLPFGIAIASYVPIHQNATQRLSQILL